VRKVRLVLGAPRTRQEGKMNEAGTFSPKEEMRWPVSTRKLDGIGMEGMIMGGQDLPNEHVLGLVLCVIGPHSSYSSPYDPWIPVRGRTARSPNPFSTTLSSLAPHPPLIPPLNLPDDRRLGRSRTTPLKQPKAPRGRKRDLERAR
jgi:hypothetical protein